MKFCKDCKHITKSPFGAFTYRRRVIGIDPVDGFKLKVNRYCLTERYSGWFMSRVSGDCGKEARYFETKELGD